MTIAEAIEMLKQQTGLQLTPCPHFSGWQNSKKGQYLNVVLEKQVWHSNEFATLQRFANQYKTISVEPNGVKRVAIFLNN